MPEDPENPRPLRKYYRKIFQGNMKLFTIFCRFYDEAVEEGSAIPIDQAWIRFKNLYIEMDEGWVER